MPRENVLPQGSPPARPQPHHRAGEAPATLREFVGSGDRVPPVWRQGQDPVLVVVASAPSASYQSDAGLRCSSQRPYCFPPFPGEETEAQRQSDLSKAAQLVMGRAWLGFVLSAASPHVTGALLGELGTQRGCMYVSPRGRT